MSITATKDTNEDRDQDEFDSCSNEEFNHPNDDYLIMGLSKGTIIFVKVDDLESIYARFSVHSQQVEHIHEMHTQKKMLSICAEYMLNIWGFEDNKFQKWRSYNLRRPVEFIRIIDDPTLVYIVFPTGDSIYMLWDEE